MERDFSGESGVNFVLRAMRSIAGRTRGVIYSKAGLFHDRKAKDIIFGKGAIFLNSKGLALKSGAHFGRMARLECFKLDNAAETGKISIGEGTSFGDYLHIGSVTNIIIGNRVLGGSNITIVDHNHGNPREDLMKDMITDPKNRALSTKGPIEIEDDVWIGDQVIILSGVKIGKGAIIAAQTIVRKSIASRAIYHG